MDSSRAINPPPRNNLPDYTPLPYRPLPARLCNIVILCLICHWSASLVALCRRGSISPSRLPEHGRGDGCGLVAELRIICRVLPLTALRLVSVYAIFLCFRLLGR